jgi:hypothetical protein
MAQPDLSETEIVNRALGRIGASRIGTIGDLSTDKGALASTLYYEGRDALLRRYRWNFARAFKTLASLTTAPIGLALMPDPDYAGQIQYTGAYQLPADYIRLSSVSPYDAHWRIVGSTLYTDSPAPLTNIALIGLQPLGSDGADNQPGTSQNLGSIVQAGIEYIRRVTDVTQFDPLFTQILSKMIAYECCFGTNALESLRKDLRDEGEKLCTEAGAINGMEQWPEQLFDTVLVDVRYGYSNSAGSASGLFG